MPLQGLSEPLLHLIRPCLRFILEFRNLLAQLGNKFDILTDVKVEMEGIAGDFSLDFFGAVAVFESIVSFVVIEMRGRCRLS